MLEEQNNAERDQRGAGELLGRLPHPHADAATEADPDLRSDERLGANRDHKRRDGQAQEPSAEPDRQLVEADAHPERQRSEQAALGKRKQRVLLVVVGEEHVCAQRGDQGGGDVVGDAADRGRGPRRLDDGLADIGDRVRAWL